MLMYSCSVLLINVLGLATCTRPSSTGTTALRVLVVLLVVVLRTTATYYSQPADTRRCRDNAPEMVRKNRNVTVHLPQASPTAQGHRGLAAGGHAKGGE